MGWALRLKAWFWLRNCSLCLALRWTTPPEGLGRIPSRSLAGNISTRQHLPSLSRCLCSCLGLCLVACGLTWASEPQHPSLWGAAPTGTGLETCQTGRRVGLNQLLCKHQPTFLKPSDNPVRYFPVILLCKSQEPREMKRWERIID